MCTNPSKDIQQNNKKAKNTARSRKMLSWIYAFIDCTEHQIPRPKNKRGREDILFRKEKKTYCKDTASWSTTMASSSIKQDTGKDTDTTMTFYKKNRPVTPKQVVNVFDLGYLGSRKIFQIKIVPAKQKEEESRASHRRKRVQPKPC